MTNLENIDTTNFGNWLQQLNPLKIISISWSNSGGKEDKEYQHGPIFHLFNNQEDIMNNLRNKYRNGFIIEDSYDDDVYGGSTGAVVQFNDQYFEIKITYWDIHSNVHRFFNQNVYQQVKQDLSQIGR